MKVRIQPTHWLQVAILILLTLNLLFMATQTALATFTRATPINSDVLKWANLAADRKQWTEAATWYAVYIDREPPIPLSDTTYWDKLKKQLESMKWNASEDQDLANDTRANKDFINNCFRNANRPIPGSFSIQTNPPAPLSMIQMGPAPDEVWVFQDFDFRGPWNVLTVGNYISSGQFGLPDNSISSVMVGSKVRTYLCTDEGLNGVCGMFDSHVPFHHPNLSNNVTGDNTISSIRVELESNTCTTGPNEVTVFMHADFKAPCKTLQVGDYSNSTEFDLPDNGVSSIRVGSNVQAYLCQNNNLTGTCETINYTDNYLGDNANGIGNDQLSSIRITVRP